MSDPWEDEGFGGENDWAAESVERDLEEDELLEDDELKPGDLDEDYVEAGDDDEQ